MEIFAEWDAKGERNKKIRASHDRGEEMLGWSFLGLVVTAQTT
jgi:hypothetical protein